MGILSKFKGKGFSSVEEILSVKEMWERALGPEDGKGGRPIELLMALKPLRLVPLNILEAAEKHLQETGKVNEVATYLLHAFYLYRGSVCEDIAAPHVERNGVLEWPDAETLSWTDIPTVIFFGAVAHRTPETVEISVREGDQIHVTNLSTGLTAVREVKWRDNLATEFKYRVSPATTGFVFQQGWQTLSLRTYSNSLYWFLEALTSGDLTEEKTRETIKEYLVNLKVTSKLPVAFYKDSGREGREFDLMEWMF